MSFLPNQPQLNPPKWPESVIIIDEKMHPSQIFELTAKTSDNYYSSDKNVETGVPGVYGNTRHFVEDRYAVLFKPGKYDVSLEVGYYTQVAGLGDTPEQVEFTGKNDTLGPFCPALRTNEWIGGRPGLSLDTFWRVTENYSTKATKQLWAVSQAAPIRRVHVHGDLYLHDAGAQASGGHMANCIVDGAVSFGSQQQFCCRSVQMGTHDFGAWSNVFVDCTGGVPGQSQLKDTGGRTVAVTVDKEPKVTVEKPFVSLDTKTDKYFLHVPQPRFRKQGQGPLGPDHTGTSDEKRDFSNVFVPWANNANDKKEPDLDVATKINAALEEGLDIVLSPGMYYLSESLVFQKNNQVILGLGLATLVAPVDGTPCIRVPPRKAGVRVAGIMLEASKLQNETPKMVASFIEWGRKDDADGCGDATKPGVLTDVFARVGGSNLDRTVSTDTMIRIHSGNVYGDNLWLWRADHVALIPPNLGNATGEVPNFPPLDYHQVTAGLVQCETGLEVNGDNVTIHGLAVEHTIKDQVIWNGKNGNVQFYQSELPYDVNNFGFVGYKVTKYAEGHVCGGAGIYSNFRDYDVDVKTAISSENSNATFINPFTKFLNNNGSILNIVNENGTEVNRDNQGPSFLSRG